MTMDLYGHLLDANVWVAAEGTGDISGTSSGLRRRNTVLRRAKQGADLQ
jgi:hypothetical protein